MVLLNLAWVGGLKCFTPPPPPGDSFELFQGNREASFVTTFIKPSLPHESQQRRNNYSTSLLVSFFSVSSVDPNPVAAGIFCRSDPESKNYSGSDLFYRRYSIYVFNTFILKSCLTHRRYRTYVLTLLYYKVVKFLVHHNIRKPCCNLTMLFEA